MPGNFIIKASQQPFLVGEFSNVGTIALPIGLAGKPSNWIELNHHWPDLTPVAGASYRVVFADGSRREGTLDDNGHARLEDVPGMAARVYFGEDSRDWAAESVKAVDVSDAAIVEEARCLGLESDEEITALVEAAAYRRHGTSA